MKPEEVSLAIGKGGLNIKLASMLTEYTIDVFRELDENVADEDIYLDEFRDEIDGWVIDAIKAIGIDTAKSVLNAPREMLIEKTKETYYEALQASSVGWHEGENSYEPFVKYYLGIMLKAYNEFESRVEHLKYHNLSKPDRIKAVIDNKVGKITKKEIMELCPDISKVTVERTLTDLVKSGYIAKVGAGPSTGYVRI